MIDDLRQTGIMAGSFCIGASLAVAIAPGDIFLWVATGIVLGVFAHLFFEEKSGRAAHLPFFGRARMPAVRIRRLAMFCRHPKRPSDNADAHK